MFLVHNVISVHRQRFWSLWGRDGPSWRQEETLLSSRGCHKADQMSVWVLFENDQKVFRAKNTFKITFGKEMFFHETLFYKRSCTRLHVAQYVHFTHSSECSGCSSVTSCFTQHVELNGVSVALAAGNVNVFSPETRRDLWSQHTWPSSTFLCCASVPTSHEGASINLRHSGFRLFLMHSDPTARLLRAESHEYL